MDALAGKAYELRHNTIRMVHNSRVGRVGGDLSVTDILAVLYFRVMDVSLEKRENPDRDRFLLSKGHCADTSYCVLRERGFYDEKETIKTFSQLGSRFIGHPNMEVPGVEMNSGSLGHGISVSVGITLTARMDHQSHRTYVVLGDGEMTEGPNYESMMTAGHYKLDNLCAMMDLNRLQINGTTGQVMSSASLADKLHDFGWNVIEVSDGNNCAQLVNVYGQAAAYRGKPTAVITSTVKGRGVSFTRGQVSWYHRMVTEEQYGQAVKELKEVLQQIK